MNTFRKMKDQYIFLQTLLTICSLCDTKLFKETREKNIIPTYTNDGTLLGQHIISRYVFLYVKENLLDIMMVKLFPPVGRTINMMFSFVFSRGHKNQLYLI